MQFFGAPTHGDLKLRSLDFCCLPTSHPRHSPEDPHGFFFNATCTIQKGHHVAPFHVSFQEMRHEILCTCH